MDKLLIAFFPSTKQIKTITLLLGIDESIQFEFEMSFPIQIFPIKILSFFPCHDGTDTTFFHFRSKTKPISKLYRQ
ncbi:MAG: hypothetical protein CL916_05040 [Deltaproteobacteria bacterium]|nr:hypothetical protein [Deltaproteobacteria bacterium]